MEKAVTKCLFCVTLSRRTGYSTHTQSTGYSSSTSLANTAEQVLSGITSVALPMATQELPSASCLPLHCAGFDNELNVS